MHCEEREKGRVSAELTVTGRIRANGRSGEREVKRSACFLGKNEKRAQQLTWRRLVKSEFGADSGERAMAATGGSRKIVSCLAVC